MSGHSLWAPRPSKLPDIGRKLGCAHVIESSEFLLARLCPFLVKYAVARVLPSHPLGFSHA